MYSNVLIIYSDCVIINLMEVLFLNTYTISEFAKIVGVSVTTLQRWDRDGILKAGRSVTNRRFYTDDDISKALPNRLGRAAQSKSSSVIKDKKSVGRPGVDLTDQYFGELHVIGRADDFVYASGRHDVMWLCECSCGNKKAIRTANLVSGGTISCGCMRAGRRYMSCASSNSQKRSVSDKVLKSTEAMVDNYYGYWHVDAVDYDTCNGSDTKIRLKCTCKCGTQRSVLRSSLLQGTSKSCGCYRREVMRSLNFAEDLTGREFGFWKVDSRGETRHYVGGGQVTMWNCTCRCGTKRLLSRAVLKSGESQSCGCMGEPGMRFETIVSCCLDDMCASYVRQKSYDGLVGVHGGLLSYDFLVYYNEIVFLVECQGEQHYNVVEFFGGQSVFDKQQEHDRRKRDYAMSHDIPLLEIPYTIRTYEDIFAFIKDFVSNLIGSK